MELYDVVVNYGGETYTVQLELLPDDTDANVCELVSEALALPVADLERLQLIRDDKSNTITFTVHTKFGA